MVAERTPTRYQRIRLFVSSSSPLALYPNTLYSTLSSRADLACSLSCCNPWILSSHPSRSRSTPPLLYIVPRAGNDAPILRFQSGRNRGDPSAIHRISNERRRYPVGIGGIRPTGPPGSVAWNTGFVLSTAPSRRVQGLGVPVRAEIFRFDDPNLFSAAESMSLTSATTTPHRWGNFDGEIW